MRLCKPLIACTLFAATLLSFGAGAQQLPKVTSGLNWLQGKIAADGSVTGEASAIATAHQARVETYLTLKQLGTSTVAEVDAIGAEVDNNNEYTARKIVTYSLAGRDASAFLTQLLATQNSDGGFGAYAGSQSNALDTAWALRALAATGNTTGTATGSALTYLQSAQGSDGSFGIYDQPSTYVTAIALLAMNSLSAQNTLSNPITLANNYLVSQQIANGSWGSVDLTSLVYLAIHDWQPAQPIATTLANFFANSQAVDGSWGSGDPYITALALRAYALTAVAPSNPTLGAVTGVIKDQQLGLPLPGVIVTLVSATTSTTTTAAGGQFSFGNLAPGNYGLLISLAGYSSIGTAIDITAGQTLNLGNITMDKLQGGNAVTIAGTVTDAVTSVPVAGATVSIVGQTLSALTDAGGNYEITNVPVGTGVSSITVKVVANSYLTAQVVTTLATFAPRVLSLPFTLVPSAGNGATTTIVSGHIVANATGLPLAGVAVTAFSGTFRTTTDASGNYSLKVTQGGLTTLSASLTNFDTVNVTITMSTGGVLFSPRMFAAGTSTTASNNTGATGIVLDAATNAPLAGVTVVAAASNFLTTVTTGADGRFSFFGRYSGTVNITFSLAGYNGLALQTFTPLVSQSDIGQIRLRSNKTTSLLPDLTLASVSRSGANTDPQSLVLSGTVTANVANIGFTPVTANVQLLAFYDANRDGIFTAGTDTVLGKTVLTGGIGAGVTTAVSIPVQGLLPFRDAPISVWVDSADNILERNEGNNIKSTASAATVIPNKAAFAPVLKWQWNGDPFHSFGSIATPMVGPLVDTNGDGKVDDKDIPTVIMVDALGIDNSSGIIRALSGKDGHELWNANSSALFTSSESHPAIGDIDGDGKPDVVFLLAGGGSAALNGNGTLKWTSAFPPRLAAGPIVIADLDGNGHPSILARNYILNNDGTLRLHFNAASETAQGANLIAPIVADLDGDGKPEIIVGNTAVHADGSLYWQNTAIPQNCRYAVGSFFGNGKPQLACVAPGFLYLIDFNGTILWGPVAFNSQGYGLPVIADFDGDGVPDIGVSGVNKYSVYNADGSLLWNSTINDGSAGTGSTAFDFDGDGHPEIVYFDEQNLRVYDGATGNTVFSIPNQSATASEYPVVVDVDGDGHADILVVQNNKNPGLRVFQDQNNAWVRTRKIWNEFNYRVTNVNDDGSIPRHEANSWQVTNTYRTNLQPSYAGSAVPDVSASYVQIQDRGGLSPSTLTVRVGNAGGYPLDPGIKIAFYKNAVGTLIAVGQTTKLLVPGDYEDVSISVSGSLAGVSQLIIVADDNGAGVTATQDFDRTNNKVTFAMSALPGSLSVAAATDQPSYGANANVFASAAIVNAGSFAATATTRFTVESADGATSVATLTGIAPVVVNATGTATVTATWNTGTTYVGNYRVKVELIGSDGRPYATAFAPFAIIAAAGAPVDTRVTTNKLIYPPFDTVSLSDRIQNRYVNQILSGLTARTTVLAPDNSVFWTNSAALPQLVPGAMKDLAYNVPLATAGAGTYTATLQVLDATSTVVATTQATFIVQSSADTGVGLRGSVSATPWRVDLGDALTLNASATNNGNSAINLAGSISVVNPLDGTVVQQFPVAISLPVGGQQSYAQAWTVPSTLTAGTYLLAFSAQAGANAILLGQDIIVVGAATSFSFNAVTNAPRSTLLVSNTVAINGLVAPDGISITGGEYSINGGAFTGAPGVVNSGDLVAVRQTSAMNYGTKTTAVLTVGVFTAPFDVTTLAARVTPDAFSFTALANAAFGATVQSNAVAITGIDIGVPVTIAGGQYAINGGPFTGAAGVINPGDSVVVQLQASAQPSTLTTAILTVGGVSATFGVTTVAAITTPDPFGFAALANAPINTLQTSAAITVTGINVPVPVSIVGGAYSVNGGAYTAAPGTVSAGASISVQQTSSSQYGTLSSAVLSVSNVSASFDITTVAARIVPDAFAFAPATNVALNSVQTAGPITVTGIDIAVPISVGGGAYSINGGTFTSAPGAISPGDTVSVQQTASAQFSTKTTAVLTIGTVSAGFDATTLAAITTPSPFGFTAVTNVALNSVQTSNAITVGAINTSVPISIVGGSYSINGGAFTNALGNVNFGDTVVVRQSASASFSTKTTAVLTISTVSAGFDATTLAAITTPSPFAFTAVTNVALNSVQTSNAITVGAINTSVPISIVGGSYSINGGAFTSAPGNVNFGDTVAVRQTASASFSTKTTATLTISTVSAGFDATTLAAITTPSPFSFTAVTNVALSSVQTSNAITVGAINTSVPISVTGGTYSINGGAFTSAAGNVSLGDTIVVRQTASASFSTKTTATLTISTVSAGFDATTLAAITAPNPFSFTAQTNVAVGAVATSNTVTITGINTGVPISVSGGSYSLNGGAYTSAAGTVNPNDMVNVRQTASASFSTKTTATVTIGGVAAGFDVTTLAAVTTPDPFSFTAQTNVALSTVATSNSVTITGINTGVAVTVAGGSYSLNGGAYTSAAGTVHAGDTLSVRQTSSATGGAKTTATLTVGTVSAGFDVTTTAAVTTPNAFTFVAQTNAALNAVVTSNTVTITGITVAVPISITGGSYSINGGAFTTVAGNTNPHDHVAVRPPASARNGATTTAILTISTVSSPFAVTTVGSQLPTVLNEITRDTRLLVLLSCENSQGNADPACLDQKKTFLTAYLSGLGIDFRIDTDTDSFQSDLRCGYYNTYWIAGGALKLKNNLPQEIAEAVFRGDSLIVDGAHDSRNGTLDPILGIALNGNLPQATTVLLSSNLLPSGSFAFAGDKVNKTKLTTGGILATFDSANGNAAIVLNSYGQGRGLVYLFDLVATLQAQSGSTLLAALVNQSLTAVLPAVPASVIGDAYVPLDTKVTNPANSAQTVDVIATVPLALVAQPPLVPAPASTVTNASSVVYTWHLIVPANGSQFIDWAVRAPSVSGSYTIGYQVNLINGATSTPLIGNNVTITVAGADQGAAQTVAALQGLATSGNADNNARNAAVSDVQTANSKVTAGLYEDAVTSYVAAVTELAKIGSVSTTANELSIDKLLQEAGRKWCRAGSSCAVSTAGLPANYNVTVFGSASFSNGQSDGSLGVGGAASLSSWGVAANLHGDAARLIVGGSLSFGNGSVGQNGSGVIKVAGSASVSQSVGRASLQTATVVEDWVAMKTQYLTFTDRLASLTGAAVTAGAGGAFTCAGSDPVFNVCTLTGSQLTLARTLNFNYPNTASVLVNVTGTAAATASNGQANWNGQALSGSSYASHVFFNFPQMTGLTVSGFGIGGTVLAPRASLSHSNSAIDGQVIVNSLSSTGSYRCTGTFQGALPMGF